MHFTALLESQSAYFSETQHTLGLSQAISLKRIADALEKQNEISKQLLEVQVQLEMSTRGLHDQRS